MWKLIAGGLLCVAWIQYREIRRLRGIRTCPNECAKKTVITNLQTKDVGKADDSNNDSCVSCHRNSSPATQEEATSSTSFESQKVSGTGLLESNVPSTTPPSVVENANSSIGVRSISLSREQIRRYSRHLILPELGPECQSRLLNAKVLVVGAGGLACTVIPMLAAAGIGTIGIVDDDVVDESNLHRQIMFKEKDVSKTLKVEAMRQVVSQLNSRTSVKLFATRFNHTNAMEIVESFDVVVDATDNLAARYVINDACGFLKLPLISGAAQGIQGQVTVFQAQTPESNAGCYRCLYPEPPGAQHQGSCEDDGVLGPVPGLVGSFMALETVKVVAKSNMLHPLYDSVLLMDLRNLQYGMMCVKKSKTSRGKCLLCSAKPTITSMEDTAKYLDFHELLTFKCETTTAINRHVHCSTSVQLMEWTPLEYVQQLPLLRNHILIDVRNSVQFSICSLMNSINIPLSSIKTSEGKEQVVELVCNMERPCTVVVVCRRGVYSSEACGILAAVDFGSLETPIRLVNLRGGLLGWSKSVDSSFPMY